MTLAICNVVDSSMSREADGVIYTRAGIEIAVASTKTFTSQLVALYLFAIYLGQARGTISSQHGRGLLKELTQVPQLAKKFLIRNPQLLGLARSFYDC